MRFNQKQVRECHNRLVMHRIKLTRHLKR